MSDEKWIKLMLFGHKLGCHQMPERSFFIHGYQFPVCARCTGVYTAYIIAAIVFWIKPLDYKICILFCVIMFLDWLIQRIGIMQSTNARRLVTGLMGGYAVMTLQLEFMRWIYRMVISR